MIIGSLLFLSMIWIYSALGKFLDGLYCGFLLHSGWLLYSGRS